MSRLTKKLDNKYYERVDNVMNLEIVDKLGELEDVEEELGCPLEVVFKALKQGYIYSNNTFDKDGVLNDVELVYDDMESENQEFFLRGGDKIYDGEKYNYTYTWCNLKEYKETWWLKEDKSE